MELQRDAILYGSYVNFIRILLHQVYTRISSTEMDNTLDSCYDKLTGTRVVCPWWVLFL